MRARSISSTQLNNEREIPTHYRGWYAGIKDCIGKREVGGGYIGTQIYCWTYQTKQAVPPN